MVKILNNNLDSPIYIFSGGKGLSAFSLVQSILVQFPESKIPVKIIPDIMDKESLEKGIQEVSRSGGIIVHTMVDKDISDLLVTLCKNNGIKESSHLKIYSWSILPGYSDLISVQAGLYLTG